MDPMGYGTVHLRESTVGWDHPPVQRSWNFMTRRNHLCRSQKLQQSITMATSILKATTETHLYDHETDLNSSFRT